MPETVQTAIGIAFLPAPEALPPMSTAEKRTLHTASNPRARRLRHSRDVRFLVWGPDASAPVREMQSAMTVPPGATALRRLRFFGMAGNRGGWRATWASMAARPGRGTP